MSDAQAPRSSDAAPPATAPPATGSPDGAAPIERATGLDWPTIAAAFNDAGGAALTHAELARTVEPLFTGRTGLGGGAKLAVSVEPKADDRCLVTLTATGLDSQEQREEVRTALRAVVGALG